MPNQVWPLKESNKWTRAIWMTASRWLFVGISPTSKGFAISKKIRYDRGNKTDATIFDKYPNTQDLFSESRSMIGILVDRPSVATNIPILQLLVNQKTNLFKNVTLLAEHSIDGQEHELHSYDEFKQYYNGKGSELGE